MRSTLDEGTLTRDEGTLTLGEATRRERRALADRGGRRTMPSAADALRDCDGRRDLGAGAPPMCLAAFELFAPDW